MCRQHDMCPQPKQNTFWVKPPSFLPCSNALLSFLIVHFHTTFRVQFCEASGPYLHPYSSRHLKTKHRFPCDSSMWFFALTLASSSRRSFRIHQDPGKLHELSKWGLRLKSLGRQCFYFAIKHCAYSMTYTKKKKKELKMTGEELLLKFWPCLNWYQDLYWL